jgi:hypothetical protein
MLSVMDEGEYEACIGGKILTREKGRTAWKTCSSAHLLTTSPIYAGLGLKPGLRRERPVTNRTF